MPKEPLNKVYHVINIPEKEQAFFNGLEEDAERMLAQHEAVGVAKAYLGTSVGAFAATIAVIVGLLTFPPTQKLAAAFIGFIRVQIAAIARDIAEEIVPSPEEVADTIVKGAKGISEEAQKAIEEFNRRLRELRETDPRREDGEIPPSDVPPGPPVFPP